MSGERDIVPNSRPYWDTYGNVHHAPFLRDYLWMPRVTDLTRSPRSPRVYGIHLYQFDIQPYRALTNGLGLNFYPIGDMLGYRSVLGGSRSVFLPEFILTRDYDYHRDVWGLPHEKREYRKSRHHVEFELSRGWVGGHGRPHPLTYEHMGSGIPIERVREVIRPEYRTACVSLDNGDFLYGWVHVWFDTIKHSKPPI